MLNHKFGILGAVTLGLVVYSQAARAAEVVITAPNEVPTTSDVVHQNAAPTRYFNVEKGVTLGQGQDRLGANLQIGGLTSGAGGMAGGVNLRDDIGVTPNLEAGINVQGLGANSGTNNLIGNIGIDGKLGFGSFMLGGAPVSVGGLATLGAAGVSGGLGSVNASLGIPMTAAFTSAFSLTVVPGVAYGFASSGATNTSGFTPALGLGADYAFTDRLSALIDGNIGYSNGFNSSGGDLGVRYGFTDNLAGDLFMGYQSNPLNSLNTGTVGLGAFYAF